MRTVKDTGIKSEIKMDICGDCDFRFGSCPYRQEFESYAYAILHNIYTVNVRDKVASKMTITLKCDGFRETSMW